MIYFFDGTKEAFFSAFLAAYRDEEAVLTSGQKQLALGQQTVFVATDPSLAEKAERRFLSFDAGCVRELELLLRNGFHGHEQIAFRYFKLIARCKKPVRGMLADDAVIAATESVRRVTTEIHRLHGFVRFIESESGALYAPIAPDHDVCDLLAPHFRARLKEYPFVIHDVPRKKAVVYDGKNTFTAPLDRAEIVLSAKETQWRALWKQYYQNVNIPSRERLKQMRGYMPVRYWKFMPELH